MIVADANILEVPVVFMGFSPAGAKDFPQNVGRIPRKGFFADRCSTS
jgi:hypothetical protein